MKIKRRKKGNETIKNTTNVYAYERTSYVKSDRY